MCFRSRGRDGDGGREGTEERAGEPRRTPGSTNHSDRAARYSPSSPSLQHQVKLLFPSYDWTWCETVTAPPRDQQTVRLRWAAVSFPERLCWAHRAPALPTCPWLINQCIPSAQPSDWENREPETWRLSTYLFGRSSSVRPFR